MKLSEAKKAEAKEMNAIYWLFVIEDQDTLESKYYKTFGRAYKAGNYMAYVGRNVRLYGINGEGQTELYGC